MHVVVELPGFVAAAKEAGLSDDARTRIIDRVAGRPDAGDVIPGTGGARKVRFAGRGKGKSGGYRVITFYKRAGPAGVPDHAVLEGRADRSLAGRAQRDAKRAGRPDKGRSARGDA